MIKAEPSAQIISNDFSSREDGPSMPGELRSSRDLHSLPFYAVHRENGWWISTAVIWQPGKKLARLRVCIPEPHPMSRIFPSLNGEGIQEPARIVDSSNPGPCRGNSSNIVQIRVTSIVKKLE